MIRNGLFLARICKVSRRKIRNPVNKYVKVNAAAEPGKLKPCDHEIKLTFSREGMVGLKFLLLQSKTFGLFKDLTVVSQ